MATDHTELITLKERLEERVAAFARKLSEAQQQLKSVITTLELLGYSNAEVASGLPEKKFVYPPAQLKGLTQPQALERIAKANNGRFKIKEVIPVLIEAGVLKRSKNSYGIIFGTIQRTEKYERVGPGEYALRSDNPPRALLIAR